MTASRFRAVDLAAALGVVLIWGSNFVGMKVGLRALTPFQLCLARYVFAAFPLVLFVPRPQVRWVWVVCYGLLQGVGQFGLLFTALHLGMTAALASVLMQTQVFFTAFFSFALLGEKPDRPLIIGLVLAGLGLACIAAEQLTRSLHAQVPVTTGSGLALTLAAASMWAASNLIVRQARGTRAPFKIVPFMVWSSLVPILPLLGMTLLFDPAPVRGAWHQVPWSGWLAAAYLGWVSTIIAYALWTGLLMRHPANRVAPFSLGVPIVGLAAGVFTLHESISGWQWAGIGLIAAALAAVVLGGTLRDSLRSAPGRTSV
ncbi:MAG: EamA family transporter [Geothrix sp.]|nr:EamA family transporter [Geothrix sp.]